MPLPSSCALSKSGLNRKDSFSGCHFSIYLIVEVTHLLCTCFESYWTPMNHWSTKSCVLWASRTLYGNGLAKKEADTRIECISSADVHAPLCHWTSVTKFKNKVLNQWQQNIKPNAGPMKPSLPITFAVLKGNYWVQPALKGRGLHMGMNTRR